MARKFEDLLLLSLSMIAIQLINTFVLFTAYPKINNLNLGLIVLITFLISLIELGLLRKIVQSRINKKMLKRLSDFNNYDGKKLSDYVDLYYNNFLTRTIVNYDINMLSEESKKLFTIFKIPNRLFTSHMDTSLANGLVPIYLSKNKKVKFVYDKVYLSVDDYMADEEISDPKFGELFFKINNLYQILKLVPESYYERNSVFDLIKWEFSDIVISLKKDYDLFKNTDLESKISWYICDIENQKESVKLKSSKLRYFLKEILKLKNKIK